VWTSCNHYSSIVDWFLGWLLWSDFFSLSSNSFHFAPNIRINCFIAFYILLIVYLWLIQFLIPALYWYTPIQPPSRRCLESGYYFNWYQSRFTLFGLNSWVRSLTPFATNTSHSPTMNSQVKRNLRNKKEKSTQGIKCHECLGFGHIRIDCPNYVK
jgi:hypothetical protein